MKIFQLLMVIVLSSFILIGCMSSEVSQQSEGNSSEQQDGSLNDSSEERDPGEPFLHLIYEDVRQKAINMNEGNNPLDEYLDISISKVELNEENEIEKRLNFTLLSENVSGKDLEIDYIAFVPKELRSYFLSRERIEAEDVTLKKGHKIRDSISTLVQHKDNLNEGTNEFLEENGKKLYVYFNINDEEFFLDLPIQEK